MAFSSPFVPRAQLYPYGKKLNSYKSYSSSTFSHYLYTVYHQASSNKRNCFSFFCPSVWRSQTFSCIPRLENSHLPLLYILSLSTLPSSNPSFTVSFSCRVLGSPLPKSHHNQIVTYVPNVFPNHTSHPCVSGFTTHLCSSSQIKIIDGFPNTRLISKSLQLYLPSFVSLQYSS